MTISHSDTITKIMGDDDEDGLSSEEIEAGWRERGWTQIRCGHCGGHGLRADYGNGEDFYGPKSCDECNESGFLWRSAKGVLALYPGGPFRGRDTV